MSAEQVKVCVYDETANHFSWLSSFSHLFLTGILSDINSVEKKNDFHFIAQYQCCTREVFQYILDF